MERRVVVVVVDVVVVVVVVVVVGSKTCSLSVVDETSVCSAPSSITCSKQFRIVFTTKIR